MTLPYLPAGDAGGLAWQESFGGLNLCLGAGDGEIAGMENLTGDHAPVLASRSPRKKVRRFIRAGGLGGHRELFWADDGQFYYGGEAKGRVNAGEKRFYCLNSYVLIWPDKLFYNTATEEFGALEATVDIQGEVKFGDSRWVKANRLELVNGYEENINFQSLFRAGEALRIDGAGADYDAIRVVREVGETWLAFDENSFPLERSLRYEVKTALAPGYYWFEGLDPGQGWGFRLEERLEAGHWFTLDDSAALSVINIYGSDDGYSGSVPCLPAEWDEGATRLSLEQRRTEKTVTGLRVKRELPEMEHLCQWNNRLWGLGGDSIYACWLGNPKIWYNFEGGAAGCWSVQVGSPGDFTGAVAYGGYPLFFKEDRIYRLYGTKPANFQLFETETLGCEAGSEKSLAVVGQTLYYKSRAGFVAYNGGVPRRIDAALGTQRRRAAVAGTDGRKYYTSCRCGAVWSLLVYDPGQGTWHREDDSRAEDILWHDGGLYMRRGEELWLLGGETAINGEDETCVESYCEFADSPGSAGGSIAPRRIRFRVESEGELNAWIQYDSSGRWEKGASVKGARKGLQTMELLPRRCGHYRIRLEARGAWRLWAIGREYENGSRR